MKQISYLVSAGLCLATLAMQAQAQSSVTLYGVLDVGIARNNAGTSFLTGLSAGLIGAADSWNMRPSTSNRLGFRGSEDLGGGSRANFSLEMRIDPSTGGEQFGQNGPFRGHSWVGLSNSRWGELKLGRIQNPTNFVSLRGDPWGGDYNVGTVQVITRAANTVTYASNMVQYSTLNYGGVQANVQYGFAEGGTAAATTNNSDRTLGASLVYAKGPVYAATAVNDVKVPNSANKNRYWVNVVTYDFGVIKPMLTYTVSYNNATAQSRAFVAGAQIPAGAGVVKVVAARLDLAGANNTTTKFGLGYEYFLSKRTSVHADVGTGKTDLATRTTGFEMGMKHQF